MARYRVEGSVVDTERAAACWPEARRFNGHNNIGRHSGSQWTHATLYRSRRGRYYLVVTSDWQGSRASCEWVSPEEAARFLLHSDHEIPADLREAADEVSE